MPLWTLRSHFYAKILGWGKAPKLKWLRLTLQGNYIANSSFWSLCDLWKTNMFPNHRSSCGLTQVCLGGFATLITMVIFCSQLFTHPFCIIPFPSQAVAAQLLWVQISAAFKLFPRHLHALVMKCTLALSDCCWGGTEYSYLAVHARPYISRAPNAECSSFSALPRGRWAQSVC